MLFIDSLSNDSRQRQKFIVSQFFYEFIVLSIIINERTYTEDNNTAQLLVRAKSSKRWIFSGIIKRYYVYK